MPRPVLVFDFDGTVALGDGPVRAYAEEVASRLDGRLLPHLLDGIAAPAGALDAYDLIARRARAAGMDASALAEAYLASRERLATGDGALEAPAGLRAFLERIGPRAHRLLATNAPEAGLSRALARLGLAGGFDEISTDLGKPAGLAALLARLPAGVRVLSIGDVWHNDLAPAHERGHATALVGSGQTPDDADPTMRGSTLAALYGAIEAWLAGPQLGRHPSTTGASG